MLTRSKTNYQNTFCCNNRSFECGKYTCIRFSSKCFLTGNGYINLNTATFAPNNNDDAYVVANCDDSEEEDIEPSEGPREPNANDNVSEGFGARINGDVNRSSDVSNESSRSSSHHGEVENSANSHDLRVSIETVTV